MTLARWPFLVFGLMETTWFLCGLACAALAAAFILRKDSISRAETFVRRIPLALGLFFPALLALGNLARLHIYYLTGDSARMANVVWNVAHGHGLTSLMGGGRSSLAIHFAFASSLFAPFLWIWNSIGVLAMAHGLALGAVPLILFALAKRQTKSSLVPWLIFLLVLAHPSFQELTGTILDDSLYALPFFVAAAYFFETDRPALGLLFGLLMLTAREQVPFVTAGVGLYLVFRRPKPARPAGIALTAASALLWFAEMKIISLARDGWSCYDAWGLFQDLGGSPRAVMNHALTRPWDFAIALFFPVAKLLPVLRIMSHAAFLPFAAGAALLPALIVWIPNQLSQAGTHFQGLRAHYSSFVLGPLFWAALKGLIKIDERCPEKHRRSLVALLLLVASCGFLAAPSFYSPDVHVIPKAWESAAPRALARIPPDAPVWCDGYLSPQLAMRRYIKMLPQGPGDCVFEDHLFLPDYVLMSIYWARFASPASDAILKLLSDRRFAPVFRDADLVILANPNPSGVRGIEPEAIKLK